MSSTRETPRPFQPAPAKRVPVRLLCLGNDLMADDSLGSVIAERVRRFAPAEVDIVSTPEAGFHLLDYVLDVEQLLVVDVVVTGNASPGTIYVFNSSQVKAVPGGSPHYVGLFETLELARALSLPVAEEVVIIAVEGADCWTVGGNMHAEVRAAMPALLRMIRQRMAGRHGKSRRGIVRSAA